MRGRCQPLTRKAAMAKANMAGMRSSITCNMKSSRQNCCLPLVHSLSSFQSHWCCLPGKRNSMRFKLRQLMYHWGNKSNDLSDNVSTNHTGSESSQFSTSNNWSSDITGNLNGSWIMNGHFLHNPYNPGLYLPTFGWCYVHSFLGCLCWSHGLYGKTWCFPVSRLWSSWTPCRSCARRLVRADWCHWSAKPASCRNWRPLGEFISYTII